MHLSSAPQFLQLSCILSQLDLSGWVVRERSLIHTPVVPPGSLTASSVGIPNVLVFYTSLPTIVYLLYLKSVIFHFSDNRTLPAAVTLHSALLAFFFSFLIILLPFFQKWSFILTFDGESYWKSLRLFPQTGNGSYSLCHQEVVGFDRR